MTRIKICGVTRPEDARDAALLGADAIGVNFHPPSPRSVTAERAMRILEAVPVFVHSVGVFVNYGEPGALEDFAVSLGLDAVQLHGDESPDYCSMISRVKVIRAMPVDAAFRVQSLGRYRAAAFLLDTGGGAVRGGTGTVFDWSLAAGANAFGRVIVAGGLDAANVGEAIAELHPFAVDVASGVESAPGIKDYDRMHQFVKAVREADRA
jgi:phosphoribosylanthranilate isomerase